MPDGPKGPDSVEGGIHLDKDAQITVGAGDVIGRDKITTIITDDKTYDVAGLPSPYLGLRSFTYAERARYAGRERSVEEAVAKLTTPGEQCGLLFVTGASGSGKSSFAQAGLLPALETHYALRHQHLQQAVFRPGAHPLAALDDALKQLKVGGDGDSSQPVSVLIVDQFEELFTQSQPEQREALFRWLTELQPFATAGQHVITTLRSDYLNELFDVKSLWEVTKQGIELRAMRAEELKDAILRPLQSQYPNGEKRMEPALVDRLAQETASEATYLPLLQVTLEELWKKGRLVLSNYGTLTDAIKQRADQVFVFTDYDSAHPSQRRSEVEQTAILDLFLSLVNVSPDDDPRRDVRISRATTEFTPEQRRLTNDLSRARLLSVEDEASLETINIIHETLISNWDLLRDGVKARRQQLRQRGRFEQQLQLWLANNRSEDYLLLTNVQLAEARELDKADDVALRNRDAQELLRQSVEHAEAERQRELEAAQKLAEEAEARRKAEAERAQEAEQSAARLRARNRTITIVGALALLAAVIAVFFGILSNRNATEAQIAGTQAAEQRDEAQRLGQISLARQLAAVALNQISADPERALLLALEAYRTAPLPEVENALHQALSASQVRLAFRGHTGEVWSAQFSTHGKYVVTASDDKTAIVWNALTGEMVKVLSGHNDAVWRARFSPDDKYVVTASKDGTARVWDAVTGQELKTLRGHEGAVRDAQFSPDSKLVVTAGEDGTARIWDVVSRREQRHWMAYQPIAFPATATFNSDGAQIATIGGDGFARIWDATTDSELLEFGGGTNCVPISLAYNMSGDKIVTTGGNYYNACVWEATSGTLLQNFIGHSWYVGAAAFSPDDNHIVTASYDKTARIWNVATGEEKALLRGHTSGIYTVAFDPTGANLVLTAGDDTARLWETTPGVEWRSFGGPEQPLGAAIFSPDSHHIVAGSFDSLVRVWDIEKPDAEPLLLVGHKKQVGHPAYNSDGSRIITPSDDGTVRIWEANSGAEIKVLTELGGWTMHAVAFSHDNRLIVTGGRDNLVHIRDATTGEEVQPPFEGHTVFILDAAFSPDDKHLATASMDGTARVWDVATGKTLFTLKHGDGVVGVAYSPKGQWIATSSIDQTARLWDASTGEQVRVFNGHNAEVTDIAFSPDGARIATASRDDTAIIWDVATGQELIRLVGAQNDLLSVTYSPDGKYLATTDADGIMRLYLMQIEDLVALAKSRITRELTPEERIQFLQEGARP